MQASYHLRKKPQEKYRLVNFWAPYIDKNDLLINARCYKLLLNVCIALLCTPSCISARSHIYILLNLSLSYIPTFSAIYIHLKINIFELQSAFELASYIASLYVTNYICFTFWLVASRSCTTAFSSAVSLVELFPSALSFFISDSYICSSSANLYYDILINPCFNYTNLL